MEMEGMEGEGKGRSEVGEGRVETEGHMAVMVCRGSGVCFLPDGVL